MNHKFILTQFYESNVLKVNIWIASPRMWAGTIYYSIQNGIITEIDYMHHHPEKELLLQTFPHLHDSDTLIGKPKEYIEHLALITGLIY